MTCKRNFTKEQIIAGLKAGRTLILDRIDAPELDDLLALEKDGLVTQLFVDIDDQSSIVKWRWRWETAERTIAFDGEGNIVVSAPESDTFVIQFGEVLVTPAQALEAVAQGWTLIGGTEEDGGLRRVRRGSGAYGN